MRAAGGGRRRCAALAVLVLATTGVLAAAAPAASAGAVLYVGGAGCSDSGPATAAVPLCSLSTAAAKVQPGTTVRVAGGTWPGPVTPAVSGTADAPVVFEAAPGAAPVVSGGTYGFSLGSRSHVTVSGFRVQDTTSNGIYVASSTGVVLSGNRVQRAGQRANGYSAQGIYLKGVTDSTVSGNTVSDNSAQGIYLTGGSTRVVVSRNESARNAFGWQRNANGIDVRSPGNLIVGNNTHDNEDSGIQLYPGANDNTIVGNLSWHNTGFTTTALTNCSHPSTGNTAGCITGDHGIDDLAVTGNTITGNTVWGNATAGINLEGGRAGTPTGFVISNNVSSDNAVGCSDGTGGTTACPRTKGNIRVDATSQTGTVLDRDVVWTTGSGYLMTWGTALYRSLLDVRAASGQEPSGRQADPALRAPASGDFRLSPGSPAIDMADAGAPGEQTTDLAGSGRYDDPGTPDTGSGPRSYDDAGALEFQPVPGAPTSPTATAGSGQVQLSWVAPSSGPAPTGYTVYRSSSGAAAAAVGTTDATRTSLVDTTVAGYTTYTYAVAATSPAGESVRSATATATPTGTSLPPLAPSLQAVPADHGARLTWTAAQERGSPVTGYTVYRGSTAGSETQIATLDGSARSYSDSGLPDGAVAWYQVSASSDAGGSPRSTEVPVSPSPISYAGSATTPLLTAATAASARLPVDVRQGDLLLAWLAFTDPVSAVVAPSGWTALPWSPLVDGTNHSVFAYHRVAGGAEPDLALSWTTRSKGVLAVVAYRGVSQAAPVDVSGGLASDGVSSAAVRTPLVAVQDGDDWAVSLVVSRTSASATRDISWTADPALTERVDASSGASASAAWTGVQVADSGGVLPPKAYRYSAVASSAESHHDSALLFLNPAGGP